MEELIGRIKRIGERYKVEVEDYINDLVSFGDEEGYEWMSDEDILSDIMLYYKEGV
jgi:hypothetical protein